MFGQMIEATRKTSVVLCFFLQTLEESMDAAAIAIVIILGNDSHSFPPKTNTEPHRDTAVRLLLDQRVNQSLGFLGTGTTMPAVFFIAFRVGHQLADFIPQAHRAGGDEICSPF